MPSSVSSMRVGKGVDDSTSYLADSSFIAYKPSPASFHSPFDHGSPRVWMRSKREGLLTSKVSRMAWIITALVTTILLGGVWNARQRPSVSLCISCSALSVTLLNYYIPYVQIHRPDYLVRYEHDRYNTSGQLTVPFQPPEPVAYRYADIIDTFATYKYRNTCNISSLDLHAAFSPLCASRDHMLQAMSGGGRVGFDAPYIPRGCDMRWFTTEEVCEILGRFEKVIIIGDSMMRHVIGSINVLIRKDLGYGAVTDWNFSPEER